MWFLAPSRASHHVQWARSHMTTRDPYPNRFASATVSSRGVGMNGRSSKSSSSSEEFRKRHATIQAGYEFISERFLSIHGQRLLF